MLKLLNKNTNMIFFLPDERAISLYKSDKKTFEILDGGYVEEEEVREPTIEELVVKKPEPFPEEIAEKEAKENELHLEDLGQAELYQLSKRYGLKCWKIKNNKTKLLQVIKEYEAKCKGN